MVRLRSTNRKLTAFKAKQMPSPKAATTTPPIDGPTARAKLKAAELSATALRMSFRSAI